jgi:hypothetical protein
MTLPLGLGAMARYRAPTAAKLVPDIPGAAPANSMPSGIGVGYFDCGVHLGAAPLPRLHRYQPRTGRERSNRVLAVPSRDRAELVENPPLLNPPGCSVALRNHRYHFASRAHADLPRHARHRPDSVTLPQTGRGSYPVTFFLRQCAG